MIRPLPALIGKLVRPRGYTEHLGPGTAYALFMEACAAHAAHVRGLCGARFGAAVSPSKRDLPNRALFH
jgi:hypothetical protein